MRPKTIISAYSKSLVRAKDDDDEFWDYLYRGLYWKASAAMYSRYRQLVQTARFLARLYRVVGEET